MKEVCSFWCSRCKFSHPGECQNVVEKVKLDNKLPEVGSRWYCDTFENNKWYDSAKNPLTILSYSSDELKVTFKYDIQDNNWTQSIDVFSNKGIEILPNGTFERIRIVRKEL